MANRRLPGPELLQRHAPICAERKRCVVHCSQCVVALHGNKLDFAAVLQAEVVLTKPDDGLHFGFLV
jgi:hypothetical protein